MASADDSLKHAFAAFQAGRLEDALRGFKDVLRREPSHIGALNLISIVLTTLGRFAEAETYLKSALALNTTDSTLYNYGLVLKALRRPAEAFERFTQALALKANADTWNNRGTVLNDLKRYAEATSDFDKAIALKPDYAEAFYNKGKSLALLGSKEEALAALDRALALKPNLVEAAIASARLLIELGRHGNALAVYDRALSLRPSEPVAWLGRGDVLLVLRRYDEAIVGYDKALALNANLAEAWLGRGNVLLALQRYDEALAAFDKALALNPEFAEAWNGRGNVFCELKHDDDALAAYDRALALKEDLTEAWLGRGHVFCDLGRYAEGFNAYDRALALAPDLAEAHYGKALTKLSLGEFAEAWALYEWRTQTRRLWQMTTADAAVASLGISAYVTRDQIAGKNVAVIGEQGVGDEIMFASTLDDLLRDAKSVTYQLDPRLIGIFSRSFPQVNFVSRKEPGPIIEGSFDIRVRAGSLPYVYRRDRASFPRKAYLQAKPAIVERWESALGEGEFKVGISWRGGAALTGREQRSIALEQLAPLLTRKDCRFISLQYGNVSEEIEKYNENALAKITYFPKDSIDDFDDLAGLIAALDIVVSVQNATVHLCGALGKTCLAMLPSKAEWRYGQYGSQMAWYSAIELFRQSVSGNWGDVIEAVNSRLSVEIDKARECVT